MVNIRFQCLKISTALLSFLSHLKNATGSLSFLAKIVLSYWIRGVFFSLSFFNFGKKKVWVRDGTCLPRVVQRLRCSCVLQMRRPLPPSKCSRAARSCDSCSSDCVAGSGWPGGWCCPQMDTLSTRSNIPKIVRGRAGRCKAARPKISLRRGRSRCYRCPHVHKAGGFSAKARLDFVLYFNIQVGIQYKYYIEWMCLFK